MLEELGRGFEVTAVSESSDSDESDLGGEASSTGPVNTLS